VNTSRKRRRPGQHRILGQAEGDALVPGLVAPTFNN
jgi:hypothetical protein